MKILLFDNSSLTPLDGDFCSEPKTGNFACELKELGNQITFYGQKVKTKDTVHVYKLNENGIKISGLWRKNNKLLNYIFLYLRAIPEIFKSDFIYIFYPNAFKYIAFLCRLLNKKYGLYIRGMENLNDRASHLIYKNAYVVFTVSDYFTDFINNNINKKRAYTIRPMIPFTEKDIVADRVYKTAPSEFKILFLGRIAKEKGIEELLNACKVLKDKGYQFKVDVVGDGEFMDKAKNLQKDLGIEDFTNITGAIFEPQIIKEYYANTDIYILPTYHEGFPRTLYEAMIFGAPIITTFVGGIPAIMKDNYNCKAIEPKSIESTVEGLEFAFNNYGRMSQFAKNGIKTVAGIVDSKRLTHAQHLDQFIKVNER